MTARTGELLALPLALLGAAGGAAAQTQRDTTRAFHLDQISVIAQRTPVAVRNAAASTTVLDRDDIVRLGARTLPEVLDNVPGLVFVNRDGAGELPMLIARGFFGGGETDYAILLIDGVPAAEGRTGLVEWTQIPAGSIERIEVLRGPGSAAYGDAAVGAVVNIITRRQGTRRGASASLSAGSWDGAAAQVGTESPTPAGTLRALVDAERAGGYREHSASRRLDGRIEHDWLRAGARNAYVRLSASRLENEEPGPLVEDLALDPRVANPLYHADDRTRDAIELTGGVTGVAIGPGTLAVDARARRTRQNRVRTLLVAPTFGDTQAHDEREWSLWARAQFSVRRDAASLVTGIEATATRYTSRYSDPGNEGVDLSSATGRREAWAVYAESGYLAGPRVRFHAGVRADGIASRGRGRTSDFSVSPRLGVNVEYLRSTAGSGNVWLAVARTFKAPTLDQLYDERDIRAGGATFNLSNAGLKPQHGLSIEGGLIQQLRLARSVGIEASLSAYLLDMKDEIDFDLSTFRYGNIQQSRHRGLEMAVAAHLPGDVDIRHALTVMRVEFVGGEHEGNQLKNIPGVAAQTTLSLPLPQNMRLTLGHRWMGHTWLDDANTERLDSPAQLDATLAWSRGRFAVALHSTNVTDAHGSSIGAVLADPATGQQDRLLYPMAGRALRVTVSIRRAP